MNVPARRRIQSNVQAIADSFTADHELPVAPESGVRLRGVANATRRGGFRAPAGSAVDRLEAPASSFGMRHGPPHLDEEGPPVSAPLSLTWKTLGPRLVTENLEADPLIKRFQQGDRSAFRELFVRHRGDVARLAARMVGPAAELDDIVQEVFLQVHRSLPNFRGQARFTTWLHRVTVNVVLMQRRAAKSRPSLGIEQAPPVDMEDGVRPDDHAAQNQRIQAFRRVLERLPEKKRVVFILHELEGLSPGEIAEIVEAPLLTVRTRLFYARRELSEMMRDEPALAQLEDELSEDDKHFESHFRAGAR